MRTVPEMPDNVRIDDNSSVEEYGDHSYGRNSGRSSVMRGREDTRKIDWNLGHGMQVSDDQPNASRVANEGA